MAKRPLAVQMDTLRDAVATDYVGALRAVAELGYKAVELTTLGGFRAGDLRTELDILGLEVTSVHVKFERLQNDLSNVINEVRTLGARYVVCPIAPPERRSSADDYYALAQILNQIGLGCEAQGMQLCYHNHAFELQHLDGSTGLDILINQSDPKLVQFELDVYWVAFAGFDPIEIIHTLHGRLPLVYLKDMTADSSRAFAEVGHGTLDFPAILAACDAVGVEYMIVEQDECQRPPLESIGMSLAYLRSLGRA